MSTAIVNDGRVRQLDARADTPVVVTAADVTDAEKLSRMLQQALRDVEDMKRRWNPRVVYFQDLAVTATTTTVIRLEHGFGGRVNWEVSRWDASVAGTGVRIEEHADTDNGALCLVSGAAGTVTIRVEEAG